MQLITIADIVGANTKVPILATAGLKARFLVLTPLGGNCRVGDTNTSASQGAALIQNTTTVIPLDGADRPSTYALSSNFAYVPSGTTLTVSYGV
jgi:hypothetical protein